MAKYIWLIGKKFVELYNVYFNKNSLKTLHRSLIPTDFAYYRTGSRLFFEYYKKYTNLLVEKIGTEYEFFTAMQISPGFWSVTVEKHDEKITRALLQESGISHGVVFWTPMRKTEKPKGWWRVPTWIMKRNIHSSRSAYSKMDREDYWNKWSGSARGHRKHVLEHINNGQIRIETDISLEYFLEVYKNTKIDDPQKNFVYKLTRKLFSKTESKYRIYIAYIDDNPLAGALFIDNGTTSEYWASFYHKNSRPYHLGIALIDRWFLDSYELGIQYCDLDHMRDSGQSQGYAGYTKFKESIADYDVYFHDMWIRFF